MKYISKGPEPADFTNWKNQINEDWRPCWDNLPGQIKRNLHSILMTEQGSICCYCERRISTADSHIEHFRPRSGYQDDELTYNNMLTSCLRETNPGEPKHCGHLKDNWFDDNLIVSPLSQNCESRFRYTADGCIYAFDENDIGAKETITRLGLDIDKLQAMRRKAIEAITNDMEILSNDDIDILISTFQERDGHGMFNEFITTIIYTLKNYF